MEIDRSRASESRLTTRIRGVFSGNERERKPMSGDLKLFRTEEDTGTSLSVWERTSGGDTVGSRYRPCRPYPGLAVS